MHKLKETLKYEFEDYKMLLKNVPTLPILLLVFSCIAMNIYAGKELLNIQYLALDCGFLLSWMSFLCMDMFTKRFGAKAAIKLSFLSLGCNLIWCGISFIISNLGNNWSAFYTYSNNIANSALNDTFGGTWYVLLGSTVAMAVASIVNSLVNVTIGRMFRNNNFLAFATRSYVSTALGQFADNLVFALIVSVTFFGWTPIQVIMCSLTGAVAELLAEVIFSPIGFKVCKKWEKENIGHQYLEYRQSQKSLSNS